MAYEGQPCTEMTVRDTVRRQESLLKNPDFVGRMIDHGGEAGFAGVSAERFHTQHEKNSRSKLRQIVESSSNSQGELLGIDDLPLASMSGSIRIWDGDCSYQQEKDSRPHEGPGSELVSPRYIPFQRTNGKHPGEEAVPYNLMEKVWHS